MNRTDDPQAVAGTSFPNRDGAERQVCEAIAALGRLAGIDVDLGEGPEDIDAALIDAAYQSNFDDPQFMGGPCCFNDAGSVTSVDGLSAKAAPVTRGVLSYIRKRAVEQTVVDAVAQAAVVDAAFAWLRMTVGAMRPAHGDNVIDEIKLISSAVRQAIADSEAVWPQFWPGFPAGSCSDASLVLGAILDDAGHKGFECAWGEIVKLDGTRPSHGWLQRGELIVDITADQFDEIAEPVIVATDSAWHRKWRIVTMSPGDLKEHKISEVAALYTLYHEVDRLLAHRLAHHRAGRT